MTTAEGVVNIIVKAEDKTGGVFDNISSKMGSAGKFAAKAALGAGVAAGAAITAVAVKGVMEFTKFEDQMNEVFTLLPGISGEAMEQMRGQVLDASVDMGRLPEEVVPALYQSLSAGVPQDNVFEFLDQAHKAALGGVTDLETAVDGISSVVNAYGSDVIDASEASDLMFTAVRLGKTNFEELSGSLSNVTPIASALGVNFGDVTASLAAMTSQGTPTAQATVQLRGLLQELSKEGTAVSDVFQETAGTTFQEFIAEGGNLAGALEIVQSAAEESGTPIQDMFGNVRAGLGALQLSGSGAETFSENLTEMANSAGATDDAFNTMNQGLARTFEVLGAKAKTTFIRIGDALSPVIRVVGEKLLGALETVEPFITDVVEAFGKFFDGIAGGEDVIGDVANLVYDLADAFGVSEEVAVTLFDIVSGLGEAFSILKWAVMGDEILDWNEAGQSAPEWLREVTYFVSNLALDIKEFIQPIKEWITNFVSAKDVAIGLGIVIGAVLLPVIGSLLVSFGALLLSIASFVAPILVVIGIVALLRNAWENNWGGIQEKTQAVINFIKPLVMNAIAFIKNWWAENGDAIRAKAQAIWDAIRTKISEVVNRVKEIAGNVIRAVKQFWAENGDQILAKAREIWDAIKEKIDTITGIIKDIVSAFGKALKGDWKGFGEDLRKAWDKVWEEIKTIITETIPELIGKIGELISDIMQKFSEVDWLQVGKDVIQGIADGITAGVEWIIDAAKAAAKAAWDAATGFFGSKSPSTLFHGLGLDVDQGLANGITDGIRTVDRAMARAMEAATPDFQVQTASVRRTTAAAASSGRIGPPPGPMVVKEFHLHLTTDRPEEIIEQFETLEALSKE